MSRVQSWLALVCPRGRFKHLSLKNLSSQLLLPGLRSGSRARPPSPAPSLLLPSCPPSLLPQSFTYPGQPHPAVQGTSHNNPSPCYPPPQKRGGHPIIATHKRHSAVTAPSLQSCREQPSHNSWPPVLLVMAVEGAGEEIEGRGRGEGPKPPHFGEGREKGKESGPRE